MRTPRQLLLLTLPTHAARRCGADAAWPCKAGAIAPTRPRIRAVHSREGMPRSLPPQAGLKTLDAWWRGEGRDGARARGHVTKSDLVQLVQWKLARGKQRPLLGYAKAQDPKAVVAASTPVFDEGATLDGAMDSLVALRGVGPATASAVLSWARDDWPFMSDESLLATGERTYTKKRYEDLVQQLGAAGKRWGCSAADAERVCYSLANGGGGAPAGGATDGEGSKRAAPATGARSGGAKRARQ